MAHSDFLFFHAMRVRWSEVDMQGVVFNGHYLNYFDVAFTEYWRATSLPDVLQRARDGYELFARKAAIEYLAPARFDDVLTIGVRCAQVGNTSLRFVLEIYTDTTLLVTGELTYVHTDTALRKSVRLPDSWRERLTARDRCSLA